MPEGCSVIWAELCFPIICLLGKGSKGSIIKDISVKATEEDYNAAANGKRKGQWERGQTMTVFSLEVGLWHFFRGRNTLRTKCHRQIDPGPQSVASCPSQQELTGKPNWEAKLGAGDFLQGVFPAPLPPRSLPSTVWWWKRPKHTAVWQPLLMLRSLGRLELTHLTQKNPEVFLKSKRSRNRSCQLCNWGTMRGLTAIAFNFSPGALG